MEEKDLDSIEKGTPHRGPGRPKGAKNKVSKLTEVNYEELMILEEGYNEKINSDPKYSLQVNPLGIYDMEPDQREFIKYYVQFKNIPLVSKLTGIDEDDCRRFYMMFSSQQEIRRINLAMYSRQFNSKMLGLTEIGGYLTSLITDSNVAIADRLSAKDKLTATKMLMEINQIKKEGYENPQIIDAVELEENIKDLSVKSIKQLIDNSYDEESKNEKDKIIDELNEKGNLSIEEIAYLKTLSHADLTKLLNEINGKV